MARALRAWAINRGGKNSVCNLWYGPRTRLVRGIKETPHPTMVEMHFGVLCTQVEPREPCIER